MKYIQGCYFLSDFRSMKICNVIGYNTEIYYRHIISYQNIVHGEESFLTTLKNIDSEKLIDSWSQSVSSCNDYNAVINNFDHEPSCSVVICM